MPKTLTTLLVLGGLSTAAWAFPWDTDMADALYKRAYSWTMGTLPEGTVSVNHARIQGDSRRHRRAADMTIPADVDLAATGENLFGVYCQTCHGVDGKGMAPVADNSSASATSRPRVALRARQRDGASKRWIHLLHRSQRRRPSCPATVTA